MWLLTLALFTSWLTNTIQFPLSLSLSLSRSLCLSMLGWWMVDSSGIKGWAPASYLVPVDDSTLQEETQENKELVGNERGTTQLLIWCSLCVHVSACVLDMFVDACGRKPILHAPALTCTADVEILHLCTLHEFCLGMHIVCTCFL